MWAAFLLHIISSDAQNFEIFLKSNFFYFVAYAEHAFGQTWEHELGHQKGKRPQVVS